MTRYKPLTQEVHRRLAQQLQAGDYAIDATAGNGHDTLFLAQAVGGNGHVYAFDIQASALQQTQKRLTQHHCLQQVTLCHSSHTHMQQQLPSDWVGHVKAVTFNLGYLPGSDKSTITQADSTLTALGQSLNLLSDGGLLCVLSYRGHMGGQDEYQVTRQWFTQQSGSLEIIESKGPVLFLLHK